MLYLDCVLWPAQRTHAARCMTFQRTNQSRRSWLSLLPYTGIAEGEADGRRSRTDISPSSPSVARPDRPARGSSETTASHRFVFSTRSQCVLQGDGRYSGVVLERAVLAPAQCNLGWLKEHRRGDVPASRGSVSGVSFSILHLYDPAGFRKVGLREGESTWCGGPGGWCAGVRCCRMMQHASLPRVRQSGT